MATPKLDIFADPQPLPAGMRYLPEVVSAAQEAALVTFLEALPLKPFEFVGGFVGNRRVLSFGWRYDFNSHRLDKSDAVPAPLLGLRAKVATHFALSPESFQHALVTEYAAGAGIGWHKDRPIFGDVIGVSLLAPCNFRLRRKAVRGWERASLQAQPRSAYLLSGAARSEWEHSIPPLDRTRYSVTFRNFAKSK